jgi:hypothetical protein
MPSLIFERNTMSKSASEAAQEAAEAIRTLNYATLPHEGYPGLEYPSDVYEVIGALKTALERMPQALQQSSLWLGEQYAAGKVGHDSGADAGLDVASTRSLMDTAATMADELSVVLNRAHSASAHLTGTPS